MSFPITAPRFTAEDERREIDSLTPAELEAIKNDLFGSGSEIHETDEIKEDGARQVEELIMAMADEDKQSYLRALERCPELVRRESEPIRFLRSTIPAYDAPEAAKRIVKFWTLREEVFGSKAFLPLHATGNGALSPEAIELLETGIWARLPNDERGRGVVCIDRSLISDQSRNFHQKYLQTKLYVLFSLIDESETAQRNGVTVVVSCKHTSMMSYNRKLGKKSIRLFNGGCMPLKVKSIHICAPDSKAIHAFALPVVKLLLGKYFRRRQVYHFQNQAVMLQSLHSYGILQENMPAQLGGNWNVKQEHDSWLRSRRQLELDREDDTRRQQQQQEQQGQEQQKGSNERRATTKSESNR